MIALVVITDGRRQFIPRTIQSILDNVKGLEFPGVMVDDSADPDYAGWIEQEYEDHFTFLHHAKRRGLAAGIRHGWATALKDERVTHIWHHEDDYVIPQPFDLAPLVAALDSDPMLAELTLKRNPYSAIEHEHGGYMEAFPAHYSDEETPSGFAYVRHMEMFFSQPSLIPRAVAERCLASPLELTEPGLGEILTGAGYYFGVVGTMADPPRVEHIGIYRQEEWRR